MKVFFDTEFTGLHKETTLISIGMISEHGDFYYAEVTDFDYRQVDSWISDNIIDNLHFLNKGVYAAQIAVHGQCEMDDGYAGPKEEVAKMVRGWLESMSRKYGEKLEMWSDCLAYDWVLFCDLFGHAFNIPENIYYIPFDICTLFKIKGIDPDINREEFTGVQGNKHNALFDAGTIKACYEKLMKM